METPSSCGSLQPSLDFSLKGSGLCSRLFLCLCSSLLNWQSCIVCIISTEQALRFGWLTRALFQEISVIHCEF